MANQEQLEILKQGVNAWNNWRQSLHELDPKRTLIDLPNVDLHGAKLWKINFVGANLWQANFRRSNLDDANLRATNLMRADFTNAQLIGADLSEADLQEANLTKAVFGKSNLFKANLRGANLSGAELGQTDLRYANLHGADLKNAYLRGADLIGADLSEANLTGANLCEAILVGTKIDNAKISRSLVYGISVWDLEGEFEEQRDLVITPPRVPTISVDNIKVAQFIYLILNNEEIRDVINTLTSKSVLILGRFSLPERKTILDALRNKLREYDLLPIVFDFDRPADKDFTETIKTLAGLCYFVIADVTNPKSSPLELQATVPDYQIPFVPIIQEGESPFAMMVDLQKKYNWVLNTVSYDSQETLMKVLKPLIIDPAMKKRQELRIIKAQEPEIISAKDYLDKGNK